MGFYWNTILSRWGLLELDTTLAAFLKLNAWVGITVVCGWVVCRWWFARRKASTGLVPPEPCLMPD